MPLVHTMLDAIAAMKICSMCKSSCFVDRTFDCGHVVCSSCQEGDDCVACKSVLSENMSSSMKFMSELYEQLSKISSDRITGVGSMSAREEDEKPPNGLRSSDKEVDRINGSNGIVDKRRKRQHSTETKQLLNKSRNKSSFSKQTKKTQPGGENGLTSSFNNNHYNHYNGYYKTDEEETKKEDEIPKGRNKTMSSRKDVKQGQRKTRNKQNGTTNYFENSFNEISNEEEVKAEVENDTPKVNNKIFTPCNEVNQVQRITVYKENETTHHFDKQFKENLNVVGDGERITELGSADFDELISRYSRANFNEMESQNESERSPPSPSIDQHLNEHATEVVPYAVERSNVEHRDVIELYNNIGQDIEHIVDRELKVEREDWGNSEVGENNEPFLDIAYGGFKQEEEESNFYVKTEPEEDENDQFLCNESERNTSDERVSMTLLRTSGDNYRVKEKSGLADSNKIIDNHISPNQKLCTYNSHITVPSGSTSSSGGNTQASRNVTAKNHISTSPPTRGFSENDMILPAVKKLLHDMYVLKRSECSVTLGNKEITIKKRGRSPSSTQRVTPGSSSHIPISPVHESEREDANATANFENSIIELATSTPRARSRRQLFNTPLLRQVNQSSDFDGIEGSPSPERNYPLRNDDLYSFNDFALSQQPMMRRQEQDIVRCQEQPMYLTFIPCCLSEEEELLVHQLAVMTKSTVSKELDHKITHMIIGEGAEKTDQYLLAIAYRAFVVTMEWVSLCINNRSYITPINYVFRGDEGPQRCIELGPAIFLDLTMIFHSPSEGSDFKTYELTKLLCSLGRGKIIVCDECDNVVYSSCTSPRFFIFIHRFQLTHRVLKTCEKWGVVPLSCDWVMESIRKYRALSILPYIGEEIRPDQLASKYHVPQRLLHVNPI